MNILGNNSKSTSNFNTNTEMDTWQLHKGYSYWCDLKKHINFKCQLIIQVFRKPRNSSKCIFKNNL